MFWPPNIATWCGMQTKWSCHNVLVQGDKAHCSRSRVDTATSPLSDKLHNWRQTP